MDKNPDSRYLLVLFLLADLFVPERNNSHCFVKKNKIGSQKSDNFLRKNGFNQVLKPKSTKGRDPHFLCQQSPFINKGQHKSPKSSLARLHDLRRPGYRKLVGIYFYGSMKLVPRRFLKRSKLEILDKLGMLVKKSSKCWLKTTQLKNVLVKVIFLNLGRWNSENIWNHHLVFNEKGFVIIIAIIIFGDRKIFQTFNHL